jgi:uncharacterized membrane protein YkoI
MKYAKALPLLVVGLLLGGGAVGAWQVTAQQTTTQPQEVQDQLQNQALASQAKITADQAKKAAEDKVGGTATSANLDNEVGKVAYEVNVNGQEVKVDAQSGAVLRVEQDEGDGDGEQADDATPAAGK